MELKTLKGKKVHLRALEPEDLDTLYTIENDESLWNVGETITPFSKHILKEYLSNAHKDIFEVGQLRLVICENATNNVLGMVDLFDFDAHNLRAGVGIAISSEKNRRKGFGKEALELVCGYCKQHLVLHQIFANIEASNTSSSTLFEALGFKLIGSKKEWHRKRNFETNTIVYTDELFYQLIF